MRILIKKIFVVLLVAALFLGGMACIDPDEALPHYKMTQSEIPH